MHRFDEFEPVRSLLRVAIEENVETSGYIRTIVRDAQIVKSSPDRIRTIERETYRYSVKLGRSNPSFLADMDYTILHEQEFRKLLAFFESL